MAIYQHPSGINLIRRYFQASAVLHETSRASNDGWYKSPLELDFQLHLKPDGASPESWIHRVASGTWTPGPNLDEELFHDPSRMASLAAEAIAAARKAKTSALGIVLHIADEFATAELKPELDNPGALNELRHQIETEPDKVLDDTSLSPDDYSWRLLPYPAAGSETIATAVTLSRRYAVLLDAFRKAGEEANFPVVTRALSAPLVALLSLPEFHGAHAPHARPAEGAPDDLQDSPSAASHSHSLLAVLPYPRFTVLAFFNEHGDLRLLRTLQHRGQRGPANLRHTIATAAAALEITEPEVFVLPVQREADPRILAEVSALASSVSAPAAPATAPPLECRLAAAGNALPEFPLSRSHTFTVLRGDGWATQDFLPVPKEEAEIYPSAGEMRLLRIARHARLGLGVAAAFALAWAGLSFINMIRQPEWAFQPADSNRLTQRMTVMQSQKTKAEHWDNLLEDRSKAWANMELLARLFPRGGNMMVKTFHHSVKPESAQAQARTAFVREWKISGLAREEALERLAALNTREGIGAVFEEVRRVTGNAAFQTDLPSRSIVINIRTLENSGFNPSTVIDEFSDGDPATYPYTFDLTITQRFESSDPMAVRAAKAP